jgi:hypothetical protein
MKKLSYGYVEVLHYWWKVLSEALSRKDTLQVAKINVYS